MIKPVPTSIQKKSETEMSIVWSDGQNTVTLFADLRFGCRCAECVDEWTRRRRITRAQVAADIHPTVVEAVGRYAVKIDWSDGHKTGIYTYDQLYEIAMGRAAAE